MGRPSQIGNAQHLLDQNRLLTEEIQRRVSQLAAINTVAATVSQCLDLNKTLDTALDAVLSIINVEAAGISLIDEESGELVLRAQRGWKLDFVSEPMRIKPGMGLSGQVIDEDKVIVTNDLGSARLAVPSFREEQVKALAMAPMHARGRVIGILSVMSHADYDFSQEEIDVLKAIADQVGVALDNARLYEETCNHEQRLSTVIHSVTDAIIATDNNGRISLLNEAAGRLFDLGTESLIGMPLEEAPLHPALRDKLRRALQEDCETASVFDVPLDDGRVLTAVISPLRSLSQITQREEHEGRVIVLKDVSHLKRAEETRMEFIRTAAHDLRNPLGVTLSALTMLRDYTDPDDATATEILDIAMDAVHKMQTLLDDLLNLEHIESGVGFEMHPMDPAPLLSEALRDMIPVMLNKSQTYEFDAPESLPEIDLAPQWFQRAITNYLSNASKYTPAGGHIVLRARIQADELLIEVEDNGPGIPLEAQGRLFERFYRVPTTESESKGTGLGLAIVKSIVEAHGGRVYVHSKPGEGCTFGLALPLRSPAERR